MSTDNNRPKFDQVTNELKANKPKEIKPDIDDDAKLERSEYANTECYDSSEDLTAANRKSGTNLTASDTNLKGNDSNSTKSDTNFKTSDTNFKTSDTNFKTSDTNFKNSYFQDNSFQSSGLQGTALTQKNHNPTQITPKQQSNLIRYSHLTYLLYILNLLTFGSIFIIPIIMSYARRHDADNTWLAAHFDWQIKTFWYSFILGVMGSGLLLLSVGGLGLSVFTDISNVVYVTATFAVVGSLLLGWSVIWYLYRIVRGWIALSDTRPVP